MDARPTLFTLARVLDEEGLEAIMIGNAAAALHGAPVTTLDFDFLFPKTPGNLRKLKAVAKSLGAMRGFAARRFHEPDRWSAVAGRPEQPRCAHRFWRPCVGGRGPGGYHQE